MYNTEEVIYFPTVWERNSHSFRIEDLKKDRFDEVVELFKEHFIPNDVLFKNTQILKDPQSLQSFSDQLLYVLKTSSSLVAFDENIQESTTKKDVFQKPVKRNIAGVLVLEVITKFDYGRVMKREKSLSGETIKKLIRLKEHMYRQTDFFAKYSSKRILRIYYLCVMPEYRHLELGYHLLSSAVDLARAQDVGVVVGLFQTSEMQRVATKVGMTKNYIVHLSEWKGNSEYPVFGNRITEDCALMELKVPVHSHLKKPETVIALK
ncbi:hypothetical protein RN001_008754 [Aquatica leii]|uniref:N-acetyltransferase domain-containing protein n=1 Tax=Aquatica leii TaxID=1421715 RepID=A0AAN7QJ79_9COLE|nr:hypothetical protein RN001_008754 [Aquatica leii]